MAASGADLVFEFQGQGLYDSNVFRSPSDEDDDVLFRLRPGVRIEEKHGQDLNYSLRYLAPVELSVNNSKELDNVDQYADLTFTYKPSGRVEFYGKDDFRYSHGTLLSFTTLDEQGDPSIGTSRDRVTRNTASAGVRYQLSQNLEASMSIQHQLWESTREDRQDNWAINLNPNFLYRLSARHRIGMGVAYSHQNFDASDIAVGSQVDTVNAYAQWNWAISPTMGLSVQAGPTYIHVEEDDPPGFSSVLIPFVDDSGSEPAAALSLSNCPTAPNGEQYIPAGGVQACGGVVTGITGAAYTTLTSQTPDVFTTTGSIDKTDDTVDVFAQVQLTQNWTPQLSSSLAYNRRQGAASGLGGTVIVDSVSAGVTWSFRDRWRLSGNGSWVNRESVTDVPEFFRLAEEASIGGGVAAYTGEQLVAVTSKQRVETEMWNVSARLSHQLFRKTHVFTQATYTDQESKANTLGSGSDFKDWLVFVGVRHEFEPIGLW